MLQSTAEKKHLLLTLWSGEWFENMQAQELAGNAAVPYRRETFTHKRILLDFDGDFNVGDGSSMSNNANAKSFSRISHDLDSLKEQYDSIGRVYYREDQRMAYYLPQVSANDSVRSLKLAASNTYDVDSAFSRLSADKRRSVPSYARADSVCRC